MPKVLIFAPMVGRGGVHLVVETISHALERYAPQEWIFEILGQSSDEIGLPVSWPKSWTFHHIGPIDILPTHPNLFPFLMHASDHFVDRLNRIAHDYDLIYSFSPWWGMGNRTVKWKVETPFVCTVNDLAFDRLDMGTLSQYFRSAARMIGMRSKHVIFTSEFERRHAEKHYDYAHTSVIHHTADFLPPGFNASEAEADRVRSKLNLPDGFVLAFHSAYHKDPITILRAQLYARSRSPHVPPLVMAGIDTDKFAWKRAPDPDIRLVHQTMKQIGVQYGKDFWALGFVPDADVGGLHAAATVAVSASKSEGDISGAMFCAIQAKVPIIYSELPVYQEVFGSGDEYGLHFPTTHYRALGEALIQTCEHPETSQRRAEAAFELMNRRTVQDLVADYLNIFSGAIHG